MTLKEKLDNNVVLAVLSMAALSFGAGWGACEAARVANKTERISELERKVDALNLDAEPSKRKIGELTSEKNSLEKQLIESKSQTRQLEQSYALSQKNSSNCSVASLIRETEIKKDNVEKSIASISLWSSSNIAAVTDQKRISAEYQARLISLNEKLSCEVR